MPLDLEVWLIQYPQFFRAVNVHKSSIWMAWNPDVLAETTIFGAKESPCFITQPHFQPLFLMPPIFMVKPPCLSFFMIKPPFFTVKPPFSTVKPPFFTVKPPFFTVKPPHSTTLPPHFWVFPGPERHPSDEPGQGGGHDLTAWRCACNGWFPLKPMVIVTMV